MLNIIKNIGICIFLFCIITSHIFGEIIIYFSLIGVVLFVVGDQLNLSKKNEIENSMRSDNLEFSKMTQNVLNKFIEQSNNNFLKLQDQLKLSHKKQLIHLSKLDGITDLSTTLVKINKDFENSQSKTIKASEDMLTILSHLTSQNNNLLENKAHFFEKLTNSIDESKEVVEDIQESLREHNYNSEKIFENIEETFKDTNEEIKDSINEFLENLDNVLKNSHENINEFNNKYHEFSEENQSIIKNLTEKLLEQTEIYNSELTKQTGAFNSIEDSFEKMLVKLPTTLEEFLISFQKENQDNLKLNNQTFNKILSELNEIVGDTLAKQKDFESIHKEDLKLLKKYL